MTATKPAVLHNFIDNTFVEPAEGAREEVLSPGNRRGDRGGTAVLPGDSTAP